MIKIMFVCLGNICRSPMAEFVFKDMVDKKGLSKEFYIRPSATNYEEIVTLNDYKKYDYIIGMEESNIRNIKRIAGEDIEHKIVHGDMKDEILISDIDMVACVIVERLVQCLVFYKANVDMNKIKEIVDDRF